MKFGRLTECNLRKIYLKKSYTKCGEDTSPRPLPEKLKLSISMDQESKALYSFFNLISFLFYYLFYCRHFAFSSY